MSLTSDIREWYIKSLPGMNTKKEDLENKQSGVELAQNCRFEVEPGTVSKRGVVSFYNSTATGTNTPVMSLFRFYTKGASAGKSIKICNSQAYVGTDSSGSWTSIRTGLTEGKRASFVVYKDILIVSNGYDQPWCYDGASTNTTWELGACKATLGTEAGLLEEKAYYYAVTFHDGTTETGINYAVSNTITCDASYQKIELSNIPLGPAGTTHRQIYRTDGDGSSLKLRAEIADNSTTEYPDNIADDDVTVLTNGKRGDAYPVSVGDEMPVGSILKIYRERMFMSGDPSNPNKIYYSYPYLPWYIRQTTNLDYMEVDADDGDQIMGIPIQLGTMVCIKKNNVRKLHITTAQAGADPNSWYAEDPISFVGTPAQWSIQQTTYGVIYLGWDHWYRFDGVNVQPIIDEFDTSDILTAALSTVASHWTQFGVFLWTYTDATVANTYHDKVGRYNFKRKALSLDVISDDSNGNPHGVNCFSSNVGDDENGELFYGSSTQGWVYKAEVRELQYILTVKDQCNAGTKNNVFVGGTSVAPYIEIGSASSASAIPDNVCIFWDGENTPGSTWVEITGDDDKFIKIDDSNAAGTDGTVGTSDGDKTTAGFVNYRMFKSSSVTETEFPSGAIVMYNQPTDPAGWQGQGYGYYVKLNTDLSTKSGTITVYPEEDTGAGDTIENEAEFRFIKKIGESDTWDGDTDKKVYCPAWGTVSTNGFTDVTSTYDGLYLKTAANDDTQAGGASATGFDLIAQPGVEHTSTGTGSFGIPANVYDGSDTSYWSASAGSQSGGGTSTTTLYSTHTWTDARTITSVRFKAEGSCSTGAGASNNSSWFAYKVEWTTDGSSWTTVAGSSASGSATGNNSASDEIDTTITGLSLANCIAVRAYGYVKTYRDCNDACNGSESANVKLYELEARASLDSVAVKLCSAILGKMKSYNAALTTPATEGIWISPNLELEANGLNRIYWNENKGGSDDVQFFIRTAATSDLLAATSATCSDNAPGLNFASATHGLENDDRITLSATVMPKDETGTLVSKNHMYYVKKIDADNFEISTTSSAGANTSIDSNGADYGTAVTYKVWDDTAGTNTYTDPNGGLITDTANDWLEYAIAFTAADTTDSNPKVYSTDGFVVKIAYDKELTKVEPAVPFIYEIGFRNFDAPFVDKIFKKIAVWHETQPDPAGSFTVFWKLDIPGTDSGGIRYDSYDPDTTGLKSFTVSLASYPTRWESFFPSIATGRRISLKIYKNDLEEFKLKEIKGLYTGEPVQV